MKKEIKILLIFFIFTFSQNTLLKANEKKLSDIPSIIDAIVQNIVEIAEEKQGEDVPVCSSNSTKTYMDADAITDTTSQQWRLLQTMYPNEKGIYQTEDGYLGVALGSTYGEIGSTYIVTLENGKKLPIIKVDEKADVDTINGCYQKYDGSVMEFVIDSEKAAAYYGISDNGYILSGNFNNHSEYKGSIIKMQKIKKGR